MGQRNQVFGHGLKVQMVGGRCPAARTVEEHQIVGQEVGQIGHVPDAVGKSILPTVVPQRLRFVLLADDGKVLIDNRIRVDHHMILTARWHRLHLDETLFLGQGRRTKETGSIHLAALHFRHRRTDACRVELNVVRPALHHHLLVLNAL